MTRSPALRSTPSILTAQQALALLRRFHGDGADAEALARQDPVDGDDTLLAREMPPEGDARVDRDRHREPCRVAAEHALAQRPAAQDADRPVGAPQVGESFARHQNRRTSITALLERPTRRP